MRGKYRDNVCAVLRGVGGSEVLICHRSGFSPEEGWQFPQGGIDRKKDIIDELKRELREEIGVDDISVIRIAPGHYKYDFPPSARKSRPGYSGQTQQWVLAELDRECEINLGGKTAEFDDFRWVSPKEAMDRVVGFKREVYKQALRALGLI